MNLVANHHKLVGPGWVADLIAGGNPGIAGSPPTYPGKGYVILDGLSQRRQLRRGFYEWAWDSGNPVAKGEP